MKLVRILLYVRNVEASAAFYERHFGFEVLRRENDRIVELKNANGGAAIMLHPAAKSMKRGQVLVKLVFEVANVSAAVKTAARKNLIFGAIQQADGYQFANAKDPDGNPISLSSRHL